MHNEYYPCILVAFFLCVCVAQAFQWEKWSTESEHLNDATKTFCTQAYCEVLRRMR